jgi:hypothetical protein
MKPLRPAGLEGPGEFWDSSATPMMMALIWASGWNGAKAIQEA